MQDSVPDVLGERQPSFATRFAEHFNRSLLPIQIAQTQGIDVTRTKTQTRQQQKNGMVAGTGHGGRIAC